MVQRGFWRAGLLALVLASACSTQGRRGGGGGRDGGTRTDGGGSGDGGGLVTDGAVRLDAGGDGGAVGRDGAVAVDGGLRLDAAAPGDAGSGPATLTNSPSCTPGGPVAPSYGEDSHLVAARLTPPRYPFTVTEVRYMLTAPGAPCVGTFGYHVEVFKGTGATPAATPTVAARFDVAAGAVINDAWTSHTLGSPLVLSSGEELFVAIELAGDSDFEFGVTANCIGTCTVGAADRNYWSNAVSAPYPWATLASFGIATAARIEASGY